MRGIITDREKLLVEANALLLKQLLATIRLMEMALGEIKSEIPTKDQEAYASPLIEAITDFSEGTIKVLDEVSPLTFEFFRQVKGHSYDKDNTEGEN